MEIVRAEAGDAGVLTRISFATKRHWSCPERWIGGWRRALTVTPTFVRLNGVYAAFLDGEPAGFYALVGEGEEVELEHLWVLPEFMGSGPGPRRSGRED